MVGFLRRVAFRCAVKCYDALDRRAEARWAPQDREALAHVVVILKRRFFPALGQNSLAARFEGVNSITPTIENSTKDPLLHRLLREASAASTPNSSLWIEQRNIVEVARHLKLTEREWIGFWEVRHAALTSVQHQTQWLLTRLTGKRIAHVLILPWLRRGGADKAALAYLQALDRLSGGRVLVILTEPGNSVWVDKIPAGVERVNWHDLSEWGGIETSTSNLCWLLSRLCPHSIHVMNSSLGWELFKREGKRLSANSRLFASLFWYGPSTDHRLRGYASEYLPTVAPVLDKVITDNETFPRVLQEHYGYSEDLFVCVRHPIPSIIEDTDIRARQVERLTILWASRLAPEKKLDVLCKIAKATPQHRYMVFGATDELSGDIGDQIRDLAILPNVEMHGAFDDFSALPIDQCDLFLYTSSSDGMPNVIIEAAAAGLPIVAPAVGGIAELIGRGGGWLISSSSDVDGYLSSLNEALSENVRCARAKVALERVRARHSYASFEAALKAVSDYFPSVSAEKIVCTPSASSVSRRAASITDYDTLYAKNYYAHAAGMTSYDLTGVPPIVANSAEAYGRRVLDIGGGNGALGAALAAHEVRTLTLDAADRIGPDFIRFDLARHNEATTYELRRWIGQELGGSYLATCFDVAEHIDIEHLPDFLLNLAHLVDRELLLSVSSRPSSAANRFHSSVLPVATWKQLFALAGFSCEPHDELQMLRSTHRFTGAEPNIVAISHWQRLNPFREDHASHQHYLRLHRSSAVIDKDRLVRVVREITDTDYRHSKRETVEGRLLPTINYHVNFIQDWSFARSLMDVWPADCFQVTLRRDIIAPPYLHMLEAFLDRTGCRYAVTSSVAEGVAAMESWGQIEDTLVITATEGLTSMTHAMGSLLMLEVRRRGARTLSLQHGMTVSRSFSPAAAVVGTWDPGSAEALRALITPDSAFKVRSIGSPKFLDALLGLSPMALGGRLGEFTAGYERVILIGLNLHWGVHEHDAQETYRWLERLCQTNPTTLFLVRPHPDDGTPYEVRSLFERPNIALIDEMFLLSLDWPVARLVGAVDGVITTYSTLLLDATAAGKPAVLLPYKEQARDAGKFLPVSIPWPGSADAIPVVNAREWSSGALPKQLQGRPEGLSKSSEEYFAPSRTCLLQLVELAKEARGDEDQVMAAERGVARSLMTAIRWHSLDTNPHTDRERLTNMLTQFVGV